MNHKSSSTQLSEAITWLRFPLIFLIILLHCYSVQRLEGEHEIYFKVLYPFSLWLGETGVPGFFFISGYLFFLSKKSYAQKLQTRVRTLLVPYLLWNTLLLSAYLIALAAGFPQDINGKSLTDYTFIDYLRLFWDRGSFDNGNFVPLLCPLWYIRNLLLMSILSPLLFYVIRYAREVFLLIAAVWWLLTYDNAFIPQTVLFFSLGAYFSIHQVNPLAISLKLKQVFIFLCIFFAICDFLVHTVWGTPINLQIHRLALILNIPVLLLVGDYCMRHHVHRQTLTDAAFIVFCVHYPIVVVLRKVCIAKFAESSDGLHILLYFICVIIVTLLSLLTYQVLSRYFPKAKNLLSGNR